MPFDYHKVLEICKRLEELGVDKNIVDDIRKWAERKKAELEGISDA